MTHSLFISDLHLCDERPDLTQAFFSFIEEKAIHADALYILGDFFNLWIGDDDDQEFASLVAEVLHALSQGKTDVYIMHGNRDFLIGSEFIRSCGASLLDDITALSLYGIPCLLMHGDTLCTGDTDYQALRTTFRDPMWQIRFMAKSLKERRAFAAEVRAKSMAMNSNKAADIMDVAPEEVERVMLENNAELLIHGHTHRPAVHPLEEGKQRIVLGDWDKQGWYLYFDDNGYSLESFPIST